MFANLGYIKYKMLTGSNHLSCSKELALR